MYGFDDAVAAILLYLRMSPVLWVYEQELLDHLKHNGHSDAMVTLALSSLTAGGFLVPDQDLLRLGGVDLSLPIDLNPTP
jgi:hypothetical protein